ncbi:hypothetical protein C8R45DRAFT_826745, partial [Mycena sanguinolenta]
VRCANCKNRFYCSVRCYERDWDEHQWNCSVFPVDGLPAAAVVEINDEFNGAVKRAATVFTELGNAMKEKKKLTASMLAPLLSK